MATHSRHCSVLSHNLAGIGVWAEDEIQDRLRAKLESPGRSKATRDQLGTNPHPGSKHRPRKTDRHESRHEQYYAEAVSPIPKASTRGSATSGYEDRRPRSERHPPRRRADGDEKYEPQHDRPRHPEPQRERKPPTFGRPRHWPTPEEEARLVRRVRTIRSLNLFGRGGTGGSSSNSSSP